MPTILEAGKSAVAAELDKVEKNKLAVEAGSDGQVTGSISTTRKGFTFTGYVKALIVGQNKAVSGGVRVEKSF